MKSDKQFITALIGMMLAGGMIGCAARKEEMETSAVLAVYAESDEKSDTNGDTYGEQFKIYEQFGMVYDADKKELLFKGKAVRWFEDYYFLGPDMQAGTDFFDENGVIDIYAIRDFSIFMQNDDGSFDPGGKLIGLEEFSEEEFAARNLDTIKNPVLEATTTGEPVSEREFQEMIKEYGEYGLSFNRIDGQWYFNGEKVHYFRDILISNGENLDGGKFHGVIRTFGSEDGTVNIYTIRDYENLDTSGYGTLTGVEICGRGDEAI